MQDMIGLRALYDDGVVVRLRLQTPTAWLGERICNGSGKDLFPLVRSFLFRGRRRR